MQYNQALSCPWLRAKTIVLHCHARFCLFPSLLFSHPLPRLCLTHSDSLVSQQEHAGVCRDPTPSPPQAPMPSRGQRSSPDAPKSLRELGHLGNLNCPHPATPTGNSVGQGEAQKLLKCLLKAHEWTHADCCSNG